MLSKLRSPALRQILRRQIATAQELPRSQAAGDFGEALSSRKSELDSSYRAFVEGRRESQAKQKFYEHPLDSPNHPLNFSPLRTVELMLDFVGPEQVSPHYEPLMASRRLALGSIATLFTISYFGKMSDLNWMLQSTYSGLFFYLLNYYILFEGVKFLHM